MDKYLIKYNIESSKTHHIGKGEQAFCGNSKKEAVGNFLKFMGTGLIEILEEPIKL